MWILIGVLFSGVVILAVVLLLMSPGVPAPVTDENGTVIPGSLSEKVFVDINGSRQGMFIISSSLDNPVLLIVHGGMPEYFLTDQYPVGLEQAFTVVWWEQRGIGISYDDDIPRESLTARQSIEDTIAVTRYLLERFDKDKIYLMAHSGGTFFAIQAAAQAPELYHAYIGVAQFAYQIQSEMMAYDYMLAQYRQMGNQKMVRKLLDAPVSMET
ncbi:MAG: alpha/beta hydrolase, partial [Anaerolineae bacterium]|nr:alpha/beta hydrolase [Anaerolineae bacterium]